MIPLVKRGHVKIPCGNPAVRPYPKIRTRDQRCKK